MIKPTDFIEEIEDNAATAEWLRAYLAHKCPVQMARINAHWAAANDGQRHIIAIEIGLIDPAEVAEGLIEREAVPACIRLDYKSLFIEINSMMSGMEK